MQRRIKVIHSWTRSVFFLHSLILDQSGDPQNGFQASMPGLETLAKGKTKTETLKRLGAKLWHEASVMNKAYTDRLDPKQRRRKRILLGHIDILRSGIDVPNLSDYAGGQALEQDGAWDFVPNNPERETIRLSDEQVAHLRSLGWDPDQDDPGFVTAVLVSLDGYCISIERLEWTPPASDDDLRRFFGPDQD